MNPTIPFEGVNVLNAARGVVGANQPEYISLPVLFLGGPEQQVLCTFQLSPEEVAEVVETGKICFSVLTLGAPFQPIRIGTESSFLQVVPFETDGNPQSGGSL